jgi:hypothetical protein
MPFYGMSRAPVVRYSPESRRRTSATDGQTCTLADIRRALTPPANPVNVLSCARPRRRSGARNARDRGPRRYSLVAYQAHRHRPALPRAYRRPITASSPGTHYRQRPCDRHGGGRSSCGRQFVAWNMLKLFVKSCEQSLDRRQGPLKVMMKLPAKPPPRQPS